MDQNRLIDTLSEVHNFKGLPRKAIPEATEKIKATTISLTWTKALES